MMSVTEVKFTTEYHVKFPFFRRFNLHTLNFWPNGLYVFLFIGESFLKSAWTGFSKTHRIPYSDFAQWLNVCVPVPAFNYSLICMPTMVCWINYCKWMQNSVIGQCTELRVQCKQCKNRILSAASNDFWIQQKHRRTRAVWSTLFHVRPVPFVCFFLLLDFFTLFIYHTGKRVLFIISTAFWQRT